ncbi:hypothetical protein NEHOM01_1169 [Nematocida homosporus]|uniref:uncharacterized protein n=1 Tax=Nematocida homosporus TaxID=1912981 RepID=UPI0022208E80|nr:uncharacterized protein NEHOM01_1169 [Nematocida homosporus]KAI5185946.1 hypothetical protein NEHOM01_1169 [Nematocida homosporus]
MIAKKCWLLGILATGVGVVFGTPKINMPLRGYLYNAGSHGYLSVPYTSSPLYTDHSVIIGRGKDVRVRVHLYPVEDDRQDNVDGDGDSYSIRIDTDSDNFPLRRNSSPQQALTLFANTQYVLRSPLARNLKGQVFKVVQSKNFRDHFKIMYNGRCLMPDRRQLFVLAKCFNETDDPIVIKQMFRIDGDVFQPIHIARGIFSHYFEGCAPCTRNNPDILNGKYIFLNDKYCTRPCTPKTPNSQDPAPNPAPNPTPDPTPAPSYSHRPRLTA